MDISLSNYHSQDSTLLILVNELYGEGRLQFTRLPYSHWSFAFCNEPNVQLQVESHFQGRPFHQITNFISNQVNRNI